MKKMRIPGVLATTFLLTGCPYVTVPYFDKLSVDYVCGGQPDECQPT